MYIPHMYIYISIFLCCLLLIQLFFLRFGNVNIIPVAECTFPMVSFHTPKISKAPAAAFWLRRQVTFTAPLLLANYISKASYIQC